MDGYPLLCVVPYDELVRITAPLALCSRGSRGGHYNCDGKCEERFDKWLAKVEQFVTKETKA